MASSGFFSMWTQGLLEYYCLTGDLDALEVALALGDATIVRFADPELRAFCSAAMREAAAIGARIGCPIEQTPDDRHAVTAGGHAARRRGVEPAQRQLVRRAGTLSFGLEDRDLVDLAILQPEAGG